jgi:hypothetical protein
MACILFFYTRTSIQAARLNAQKHREADGGQLNWRNESLRRHGQLEKVGDRSLIKEAFLGEKAVSQKEQQAQVEAMRRKSTDEYDPAKALDELKKTRKPTPSSE